MSEECKHQWAYRDDAGFYRISKHCVKSYCDKSVVEHIAELEKCIANLRIQLDSNEKMGDFAIATDSVRAFLDVEELEK